MQIHRWLVRQKPVRARPATSTTAAQWKDIQMHVSHSILAVLLLVSQAAFAQKPVLESGEYFISQSWSQEKDFKRPYYVSVPDDAESEKLPVFIFLHGNGGNGKAAMTGFMRRNPRLAKRYVMVFPDGYAKSWNIVSERSKADDRGFIEATTS